MVGIQSGFDTTEGAIVSLRIIEDEKVVLLAQQPEFLFYAKLMSDEIPLQTKCARRVEPILECLHGVCNAD